MFEVSGNKYMVSSFYFDSSFMTRPDFQDMDDLF